MSTRLSHPLLRFVLFFLLSLTIALPTAALAAPISQGTTEEEAVTLAYYESEVVTDAEGNDVVVGLYFYDDDTFEMYLDYMDGDDPTVVYGDYEENDDGVSLSVIGANEEDLEEPVALELVWDADDTLIIVGSPDGPMGEEDIILYPTDEETGEEEGEEGEEGLEEEEGVGTEEEFSLEIGGVYVSPIQPSEVSDGIVYMLNLTEDGSASWSSDYLNLEPPVFELGTWTDNGDDTVTVEITGTPDEEYEEAIVIDFELGEYGELMIEELHFYPVQILSFLSEESTGEEEIGSEESGVYVYWAEVILPDETEATYVYMIIYDDGTVIMTDEEETGSLYGEWTFEEEVLYVTITSDDETDLEEPVEFAFEFDEEGALVATEYPVEVFGEDGLTFYPDDEGDEDEAVTEGEFYFYESETLPSEETDGIVISVVLSADGAALVSTDLMNDEEPSLEYGDWTRDEAGVVIITVNEGPDGVYDEPFVFTFEEDPDDLSLVLVEESVEVFGEGGLVLNRVE